LSQSQVVGEAQKSAKNLKFLLTVHTHKVISGACVG
jgi:hypothetical protein